MNNVLCRVVTGRMRLVGRQLVNPLLVCLRRVRSRGSHSLPDPSRK